MHFFTSLSSLCGSLIANKRTRSDFTLDTLQELLSDLIKGMKILLKKIFLLLDSYATILTTTTTKEMKMQEVQVAITKIKISTVQFRMRCTASVFFSRKKVFLIFTHTNMLVLSISLMTSCKHANVSLSIRHIRCLRNY